MQPGVPLIEIRVNAVANRVDRRRGRPARRAAERAAPISTADKIAFVDRLSAGRTAGDRGVGVRQPEVGAADGRRRRGLCRHHARDRGRATPRWCRTSTGLERARRGAASTKSRSSPRPPRPSAAGTSIRPSTTRSRPTTRSCAGRARRGLPVRGYVSTAFGCPFEGAVAPAARRAGRSALFEHGRLRGRGQRHDRRRASRAGPDCRRSSRRTRAARPRSRCIFTTRAARRWPMCWPRSTLASPRSMPQPEDWAGVRMRREPPATSRPRICSTC